MRSENARRSGSPLLSAASFIGERAKGQLSSRTGRRSRGAAPASAARAGSPPRTSPECRPRTRGHACNREPWRAWQRSTTSSNAAGNRRQGAYCGHRRWPFQALAKIIVHDRRQRAVARVRQPDAAGDVQSRLVAPDRAGREAGGLRHLRQDIDEDGRLLLPERVGFGDGERRPAVERRWRRGFIVRAAIAARFRDGLVRPCGGRCGKDAEGKGSGKAKKWSHPWVPLVLF